MNGMQRFLVILLLAASACTQEAVSTAPPARLPVSPPPGVYALTRTPRGPLSQHEILAKQFPAILTSIDRVRQLVTIRTKSGPEITLSTRKNPDLLARSPGAPVVLRGFTSLIFSVVDPNDVDLKQPQRATMLTQEAKIGLPAHAQITSVENTLAQVLSRESGTGKVVLQAPDSSLIQLEVRYPENLKRISVGDTIALTRVEALAIDDTPA